MDDENELNLSDADIADAQTKAEGKLENKNRLEKLSEKVIFTAKERDEANAKTQVEVEARSKAEKERDFFRDFSKLSGQYPAAHEYQDKILEKVNSGYSPEDATLAVLAKEGKLGGSIKPITQQSPAGGSSATMMAEFDKAPSEMSREEMKSKLMELENQGVNLLKL